MLEIKGIEKKYYFKPVLTGVEMTIQPQRIYGLLGRNGVGKSTLLKVITNRARPTAGTITLDGVSVFENEQAQNRLYLMSDARLFNQDSKLKVLLKWVDQLYGGFDYALAEKLARQFKLDLKKAKLRRLSTGYQTIANVIIALCVPCDYIFLDEPVLGLDANHREMFYQALLATYAQRPRTFVIATHLIEEVAGLLNDVFVMENGQVALAESVEALQQRGRVVSGPAALVQDYLQGIKPLREVRLGGMLTAYTLDTPLERPLPAGVSLDGMNLQQLFIEFTREAGEGDEV
ncbi:ATP-binding cassette domain-containing protein [Lacticaseibacillus baoqingensis]|uniref:ATP-binding cassette domain-containing protein n=1 Tax=Lacticaseibacillus baoqingensis TaxID=2486013 RepID=A0ABW4E5J7_9LACO|nr:ABC transporter ATP-binding protein [Lacticaseibacillus baoqingensis]